MFSNPGEKALNRFKKYKANQSPTFNKNQNLVYWIGGKQYIELLAPKLSNNPNICRYVEKLSEEHFKISLFSNPGYNMYFLL